LTDFPFDQGCQDAADQDELDLCGQGVPVRSIDLGGFEGRVEPRSSSLRGSCGRNNQGEHIFHYINPFNARLSFALEGASSELSLYLRSSCLLNSSELGCRLIMPGLMSSLQVERVAPGDYFIIIDQLQGAQELKLSIHSERLPPGCRDGIDNDEDGFIDADDPGCREPDDEDERDEGVSVCNNGLDDDEDGLIDFPMDPGCICRGALDESNPVVSPSCLNGLDDDDDGLVDYPEDEGCYGAGDLDEESEGRPQCSNRIDDDEDDLLDYPFDPGCAAPGGLSEADPELLPECADGLDNDRDGLLDFPFEPGCRSAGDDSEHDPQPPARCSNDRDDDEDGIIDFPRDPGCSHAGDGDEEDPAFQPQCGNGLDDDRNGRIDFPDDPGCSFAADAREDGLGAPPRRCADGVDNDDDGSIDLADPGCATPRDDDEEDLEIEPYCADGIDNDEDGQVDWPEDEGCTARGDLCEERGYGFCESGCLDIQADPENCGRCEHRCNPGVECIDGFCGGLFVFEGIRQDIDEELLGGWRRCHQDTYADQGSLAQIQARCDGEYVMYGCRQVGSEEWALLAMGRREMVFRDTGPRNDLTRENGVDWYFSQQASIGFVPVGTGVERNTCDTLQIQAELRLCWHSNGGQISSGYRCGANSLNGDRGWERGIFTND